MPPHQPLLLTSPHAPSPLAGPVHRQQRRACCSASAGGSTQWTAGSSSSGGGEGGGHGFTSSGQHPRPHHAQHGAKLAATASAAANSALQLPKLAVLLTSHGHRRRRWAAVTRRVNADRATQLLVHASVAPALVLALQPLVHPAPLACWQGPLRDMFSFTVLLSVFIGCEPGAAAASAVSAAGGALALASAGPGGLPWPAACTACLLAAAAGGILWAGAAQQAAASSSSSSAQVADHVLQRVQAWLGVLGGGLLCQFVWSAVSPASSSSQAGAAAAWLAPVAAGAVGTAWLGKRLAARSSSSPGLAQLLADWPAWSATLLLILQPLQQLVGMAAQPAAVLASASSGVPSGGTLLLLVLASGLMVPRALLTRQAMWFTGTSCGALLAGGQGLLLVCAAAGGAMLGGVAAGWLVLAGALVARGWAVIGGGEQAGGHGARAGSE